MPCSMRLVVLTLVVLKQLPAVLAGTRGPLTGAMGAMLQYPDSIMRVASPLPQCMLL